MYNEKKSKWIFSHICFLSLYLSCWGDKENKWTCRLCPLITFGVAGCKMLMFSALISTATVDLCILSGCFDVSKRLTCCRSWFSFTGQLFSYAGLAPACTVPRHRPAGPQGTSVLYSQLDTHTVVASQWCQSSILNMRYSAGLLVCFFACFSALNHLTGSRQRPEEI